MARLVFRKSAKRRVLMTAAYAAGYKHAMSEARDDLHALATKYDRKLAGLQDDFQTLQLALLFNAPHFDEGKPERSRLH